MFGYFIEMEETRMRDTVEVNGNWFIVDTCKTPDAGWETGIAQINIDYMREDWGLEDDEELTAEEIEDYGNDYVLGGWEVQNYRTKREAVAGHKRVCKKGRLDDEE